MKPLFLSLFLLAACGTDPEQETKPEETGAVEYQHEEKEIVVEYRKDGTSYSIAVNDTSELPACEHNNSKQMAWVKGTNQFFSCEDESWVEVIVKGEQGDPGPKGDPGLPPSPNEWVDPITEERWLIGLRSVPIGSAESVCSDAWRLPTSDEARAAVLHGLLIVSNTLTGPLSLWTVNFAPDNETGRYFVGPDASIMTAGVSLYTGGINPGIACLRE